jgi:hypothetical protein
MTADPAQPPKNMNKTRTDSVLFQLTEAQQAQVYDWLQDLGYAKTKEKLALPPPEGFGIETHLPSLRRFLVRYSKTLEKDDLAEVGSGSEPDMPATVFGATEAAAHYGAFQLATSPVNTNKIAHVSKWVATRQANEFKTRYLKIAEENLALSEKRLNLDRDRFEMNAARQALRHFVALQEIHGNAKMDDEDKVRAARLKLFGSAP